MLFTLATNLSYTVFLTTLLSFAKSLGTGVDLSISSLCTSVFKLAKFDFSAKLLTLTCDTYFKSVFVAQLNFDINISTKRLIRFRKILTNL